MRAIRRSRMPGAAKLATGLFLVTLPVVGLIIGSDSAAASGAPTRQPAPAVATVAGHSLRKPGSSPVPRSRGSWSSVARSCARAAAPSWYTASCFPAPGALRSSSSPAPDATGAHSPPAAPAARTLSASATGSAASARPPSACATTAAQVVAQPRRLPGRSSACSPPSRPGTTTRATRPAAFTPRTASPTRRSVRNQGDTLLRRPHGGRNRR